MTVGEVELHSRDVGFLLDPLEDLDQSALAKHVEVDVSKSVSVISVEIGSEHGVDVPSLEDGAVAQELQGWAGIHQFFHKRLQVGGRQVVPIRVAFEHVEEAHLGGVPLYVSIPPAHVRRARQQGVLWIGRRNQPPEDYLAQERWKAACLTE